MILRTLINGTLIVLQTTNGCNNVYVENLTAIQNRTILKDVIETLLKWYDEYGEDVRYIQIKGRFNRYTRMCKYFGGLRDYQRTNEEVYYFDLEIVKNKWSLKNK